MDKILLNNDLKNIVFSYLRKYPKNVCFYCKDVCVWDKEIKKNFILFNKNEVYCYVCYNSILDNFNNFNNFNCNIS
jgi:hypothetical protein